MVKIKMNLRLGLIHMLCCIVIGYSLVACSGNTRGIPDKGILRIIHTNDTHAQIQGCGCRHAGGGLIKRSFKIKSIRDSVDALLVLDAGNMLFGDGMADQSKGRFMIEALNLMRYDAINITPQEFRYGIDTLKNLEKLAKADFLSATIKDINSRRLLFSPYKIYNRGKYKIGVIGVSDSSMLGLTPEMRSTIVIEDVQPVLSELVKTLRPKVDFIVVLSYSGWENDIKMAHSIDGIDLILGGYTGSRQYRTVNQTTIGQVSWDGRYMGEAAVTFSGIATVSPIIEGSFIAMENEDMDDSAMRDLIESYKQN